MQKWEYLRLDVTYNDRTINPGIHNILLNGKEGSIGLMPPVGQIFTDEQIAAVISKLRAAGSTNVLVTLGEKGVYAALASDSEHFSAQAVKAVDTTAAGDTFIGGFVAALAEGRSEAEAIALGQRAAAISVARVGAQTSIPSRREVAD